MSMVSELYLTLQVMLCVVVILSRYYETMNWDIFDNTYYENLH